MDRETEFKMLFEANAKLNSPEACADREHLAALQRLYNEETKTTEPIEVIPHIPYTESVEFKNQVQNIVQTESEIMEQIQELRSDFESEEKARLKFDKINARFQWANLILVALTLIATIIFGFRSCAGTPTNGEQGSEFAITDSVPAE